MAWFVDKPAGREISRHMSAGVGTQLASKALGEAKKRKGATMKRRTFFKRHAAVAAAAAAPAIWSEAKAQARNETLLIVGESPPNSMDIHGVGRQPAGLRGVVEHLRPADDLRRRRRTPTATTTTTTTKLELELATEWDLKRQLGDLQAAQGRCFHDGTPITAKDVKWSFDRAVTVGGFLTFQMAAGSAAEARAVRGGRRPYLPRRLRPRTDKLTMPDLARAGAGDHESRALQEERDRGRPVGHGMVQEQPCSAAPTRSSAGSRARKWSTSATMTGRTGRCPRSGASSCVSSRRPATGAPCSSAAMPTSSFDLPSKDFSELKSVAQAHRDRNADRERR